MTRWNPIESPRLIIFEISDDEWKQTIEQIARTLYVYLSKPNSTGLDSPQENHLNPNEEV